MSLRARTGPVRRRSCRRFGSHLHAFRLALGLAPAVATVLAAAVATAPSPARAAPPRASASAEAWPARHVQDHAAQIEAAEKAISQGRPLDAIRILQPIRDDIVATRGPTAGELLPVLQALAGAHAWVGDREASHAEVVAALTILESRAAGPSPGIADILQRLVWTTMSAHRSPLGPLDRIARRELALLDRLHGRASRLSVALQAWRMRLLLSRSHLRDAEAVFADLQTRFAAGGRLDTDPEAFVPWLVTAGRILHRGRPEAARLLLEALWLGTDHSPNHRLDWQLTVLRELAAAQAAAGRREDARSTYEKGLALCRAAGTSVEMSEPRLALAYAEFLRWEGQVAKGDSLASLAETLIAAGLMGLLRSDDADSHQLALYEMGWWYGDLPPEVGDAAVQAYVAGGRGARLAVLEALAGCESGPPLPARLSSLRRLAGCRTVAPLLARLAAETARDPDVVVRLRYLEAAAGVDPAAEEADEVAAGVELFLADASAAVRLAAVRARHHLGAPLGELLRNVRSALASDEPAMRQQAFATIAVLGPDAGPVVPDLVATAARLTPDEAAGFCGAVAAIGSGAGAALPAVFGFFRRMEGDLAAFERESLVGPASLDGTHEALIRRAEREDRRRIAAIRAMGAVGRPLDQVVPTLLNRLMSRTTAAEAAWALARLGDGAMLAGSVLDSLHAAGDRAERLAASYALACLRGEPRACLAEFRQALVAADRDDPRAAIDAVQRIGDLACELLPELRAWPRRAGERWLWQEYWKRLAGIEAACEGEAAEADLDDILFW